MIKSNILGSYSTQIMGTHTNQAHLFDECSTNILKPQSDHKLVNFKMSNPTTITGDDSPSQQNDRPEIYTFDFRRGDEEAFKRKLKEVNWEEILKITQSEGIETLADRFISEVVKVAKLAKIPKHKNNQGGHKYNKEHDRLLLERKELQTKIKHIHCTLRDKIRLEEKIEAINVKIQANHEEERERKEAEAVSKIKEDAKAFFKYANQSKKAKSKVGPIRSGDAYYSGPKEMARILSDQYKSVFSEVWESYDHINIRGRTVNTLQQLVLTEPMFVEAMRSIKTSSAPGPDGVPAFLYQHFAEELAKPVKHIWQTSLNSGLMPETTLLAYITPILKSVDRSVPANYRPVSLTNHLTKIFERVLRKVIVEHLDDNGLMNKTQHGFRARHSTVTQIMCYYDSILTLMESGHPVDAVYLDFSKAFDKVDHQILLKKVESMGIKGNILNWIRAFLTNRQQQVRVGDFLSQKEWVRSGVPQGSVLGPLLFIIMLIDITDEVKHSWLGSYADDTRLWKLIHGREDQDNLQSDLQVLYDWAERNNMSYNDDKFEHLIFGPPSLRAYKSPTGSDIRKKDTVKDLGVYMSGNGRFDDHITHCVKSAQQVSAWILRTFLTRKKGVLKVLLKSLIVPKVEYASVVWSPFDNKRINMFENVQRRFTSKMAEYQTRDEERQMYTCSVNYWDRLADLKIYSLERRRERFIILYAYRALIGLIEFPWFDAYVERGIKIRAKYNNRAPTKVKRNRHSSFLYKAAQLYNLLPEELRQVEEIDNPTQKHVDAFKKRLDKFFEDIPDQPTVEGLHRVAATNSLICQVPLFRRQQNM